MPSLCNLVYTVINFRQNTGKSKSVLGQVEMSMDKWNWAFLLVPGQVSIYFFPLKEHYCNTVQ